MFGVSEDPRETHMAEGSTISLYALTLKSKPGVIALKWKPPKSPPTAE